MLHRQGDVLIRKVDRLPEGLTEVPRGSRGIVLAEGEATGHAHVVECDEATFLATDLNDLEGRFLLIEAEHAATIDAWKCKNKEGDVCWIPADVAVERIEAAELIVLGRENVVGAPLRHEEHLPFVITPGIHEIRRQREYESEAERWVAD
jgi:hypothetical protein